ncbi:MAG: N-formylglutamate amidohydrolase [Rhodospirillaceae bacterium]|nr:N-formylglutamate amidohydrolase [Rhodospirillaceae bacterium]MBT7646081.1 N-formylglutamate amidohydrolase [Rhodospirillaceae bacterium]
MGRAINNRTQDVLSLTKPQRQSLPVVVSSPHSGRNYDADFLAVSRLDKLAIRRSEDAFVDELIAGVAGMGAPGVAALFPRAYLDPNREPYELDPAMFDAPLPRWINSRSPRVRAGLGTVPRVVAGGAEIYRGKLLPEEAERRIKGCYVPYHDALVELIGETRATFGTACLIDCHSMPSAGNDGGRQKSDIVIGDRFGASCDRSITAAATELLREQGLTVRRNDPYPGGFITEHYGRPDQGVHAIQLEFNRALYMEERTMRRGKGMEATRQTLERAIAAIADAVLTIAAPANAAE